MTQYLFLEYPKCSTCQKAKKWLEENGFDFVSRHIVEQNPTAEELKLWIGRSGLEIKSFFNSSGMLYKEQGIKDKLPLMTENEQIALLSSSGMLVKRPLLVSGQDVIPGFKPELWKNLKK